MTQYDIPYFLDLRPKSIDIIEDEHGRPWVELANVRVNADDGEMVIPDVVMFLPLDVAEAVASVVVQYEQHRDVHAVGVIYLGEG